MIANKIHKEREEILNFCKRHKSVYIYGAGLIAGFMIGYLKEEGIEPAGVLVGDGHRKTEKLKGHKIEELSELELGTDVGVIVGVDLKLQEEIVKSLLDRGLNENQIYCQGVYISRSNGTIMYDRLLTGKLEDDVCEGGFFSACEELEKIGQKYDTDKCSVMHNYLNKYEFFLRNWKDKSFNLLELGVFNGGSLRMWEEFFPNATVYGVDINEDCREIEGNRKKVIIRDLSDVANLEELKKISPSVIIDDASHIWSHQIKALFHLFPALPVGGVFIMEDLETSFSAYHNCMYDDSSVSAYHICSQLAEVVCSQERMKKNGVSAVLWELKEEIENLAMQIEMISFIHGSCIMIKK